MDERQAEKIMDQNDRLFSNLLLTTDEKKSGQLNLEFDGDSEEDTDQ
jgi:hypothetical protein